MLLGAWVFFPEVSQVTEGNDSHVSSIVPRWDTRQWRLVLDFDATARYVNAGLVQALPNRLSGHIWFPEKIYRATS